MEAPRSLLYISGSSTVSACAACGATETTGSWRKGWKDEAGRYVNLCNKDGQKYKKAGMPTSLEAFRKAEAAKAAMRPAPVLISGPPPAAANNNQGGGGSGAKRPAAALPLYASTGGKFARLAVGPAAPARVRRLASDSADEEGEGSGGSPCSSPGDACGISGWAWAGQGGGPLQGGAAAPLPAPAPRPQPAARRPQKQQPAALVAADGRRFVAFTFQRLRTPSANHVAVWLCQGIREGSLLAAMGTDTSLKGRYSYVSSPAADALGLLPPLRGTSRAHVEEWLAGGGLKAQLAEGTARLPELSSEERDWLLTLPTAPVQERSAAPAAGPPRPAASDRKPPRPPLAPPTGGSGNGSAGLAAPARRALPRLALSCNCCGLSTHATDDCPLALISPPSLIVTDGLPQGVRRNYSWLLPGAPVKEAALPPVDSPQLLSKEQLLAEAGSISRRLSGGAGGAPVPRKISAELQAAFAPYPRLLSFVAATPPAPLFAQIERYAQRLSAHISDLPPPLPASAADVPVGGWSWTSTGEALRMLGELSTARVSLSLLEQSGISRAVAQLRTHPLTEVAAVADEIVKKWRECARAALAQATGGAEGLSA